MWILSAIAGFILTNFDTFFIMLMLQSYTQRNSRHITVLVGFLLGMSLLVALALLGLNLTQWLIQSNLNIILALVFIFMALMNLLKKQDAIQLKTDVLNHTPWKLIVFILGISIVSGMDNIVVYMGLFNTMDAMTQLLTIGLHFILVTLIYGLSRSVTFYPSIQDQLSQHQALITAILFIYLAVMLLII